MGAPRCALALCLALPLAARAVAVPPPPGRWVTDEAGFLSPAVRGELDRRLEAYERATGHQVLVWIGRGIGGEPLEEWAVRTFESWGVGRRGLDDGLVLFVLADERKVRIEVGYGLEERVPDAVASRIVRQVLVPGFRSGQRDRAVAQAIDALLFAIEGKPLALPPAPPEAPRAGPLQTAVALIIGVAFLLLLVTHPRLALNLLFVMAAGRGRGFGGRMGGGGFSGRGGRSGGGGASGSW
ncbi:MAG: TPM domain-containing protein [Myxococcales bacterium]|nr:TPM domain-containing protein [Myxococcales bacterium]